MLQKKPFRKPARRKAVALLRAEKVKRLAKSIEGTARLFQAYEAKIDAGLNSLPAKTLDKEAVQSAENAAKNFIKAREEIIGQHRKQVKSAARIGLPPVQPYGHELHENYARAKTLLEKINRYRSETNSR